MLRHVQYYYTTTNLGLLRDKYNLSVCYRSTYNFLVGQKTISKNLSNRIAIKSNFIKSYKQLRKYYIARLKKIFLVDSYNNKNLFKFSNSYKDISYFYNVHKQFKSLNCLDRALLWRANQINSIFKINYTEKKKKKKYFYKSRISFVTPHKRILMVWRWLTVFIKAFTQKNKPWGVALGPSLENFLVSYPINHVLTDVKLQIYKLQLLRTL